MILDTSVLFDFLWGYQPVCSQLQNLLEKDNHENFKCIDFQRAELCDLFARKGIKPEYSLNDIQLICQRLATEDNDLIQGAIIKNKMRKKGNQKISLADSVMLAVSKRTGLQIPRFDLVNRTKPRSSSPRFSSFPRK